MNHFKSLLANLIKQKFHPNVSFLKESMNHCRNLLANLIKQKFQDVDTWKTKSLIHLALQAWASHCGNHPFGYNVN